MYLKTLTLKGFKSFASATTLEFGPGITSIVGPNGSGKSNIVDALAWVMGEQGAKSLRGGQMSDVIFQGTSSRAPLGRAEVTLTIDNTDGVLPIDYTEVRISRTLFRNGGSEYAINGNSCRLLDVQELLSDTGMGREMHVIVGQGQLDAILAGTPEQRRVFIEEAAGVLKHRRRKEKATRKLEATAANLERLADLIAEIRRQLKPLGRQAQVARKAAVIQAELRDARARLLADDLTQATAALDVELADEQALLEDKRRAEAALEAARALEVSAEQVLAEALPTQTNTQEVWYALSALRQRTLTTTSIAAERIRFASQAQLPLSTTHLDPDLMDAGAAQARAECAELSATVETAQSAFDEAKELHFGLEDQLRAAEREYSDTARAVADQRDGLSKITKQVTSLEARLQAGSEEISRLESRSVEAGNRASNTQVELDDLGTTAESLRTALVASETALAVAEEAASAAGECVMQLRLAEREASDIVTALNARLEALLLSATADASSALQAGEGEGAPAGVRGPLSNDIKVKRGWEAAISVALGSAADALTADSLASGVDALEWAKRQGLGRTQLLLGEAPELAATVGGRLPVGAQWAASLVRISATLRPALDHLLSGIVAVETIADGERIVSGNPDLQAVTRDGDFISAWLVQGGSKANSSAIEIGAAIEDAKLSLADAQASASQLSESYEGAVADEKTAVAARTAATEARDTARRAQAAHQQRVLLLEHDMQDALADAKRMKDAMVTAMMARETDEERLAELSSRLQAADAKGELHEPDPALKDRLSKEVQAAIRAEMEAGLALRSTQERLRLLTERADSLERAAATERATREAREARAEQFRIESELAAAVQTGAKWLLTCVDAALERAKIERDAAQAGRIAAEAQLGRARSAVRDANTALERVVEGSHRDEMARMEHRLRIEALAEKALTDLGLDQEALLSEYGPELLVPVLLTPDDEAAGKPQPDPKPYVREEQLKRLRVAENDLQLLGAVNPLALEEFEAMNARHTYLATQVEDLKQTRKDLLQLIDEVDAKVLEAFTSAYTDVQRAFEDVFSRLFPGGKGKLSLTGDTDMLTTGVEVSAKPAGKKVERLSLLSGGERSLVAVAFLLALFIARPSPFYILDEVEAALDETNLSRLLGVYEELRLNSQLLIITHQKRTMEIADALYGITMKSDGVSAVVSQRLDTAEQAPEQTSTTS
ncbi:MAG: chromosome segregation protein SMC [Propionibacteriaceae bacterium]|jgi:chromosome segregation protein|nr:chromosome segregation protein SMC [Propionibacteriaceae bacterium]